MGRYDPFLRYMAKRGFQILNRAISKNCAVFLIICNLIILSLSGCSRVEPAGIKKDNGHFILLKGAYYYNKPRSVTLKNGKVLIVDTLQGLSETNKNSGAAAQLFDPHLEKFTTVNIGTTGYYPALLQNGNVLLFGEGGNKIFEYKTNTIKLAKGKLPKINNVESIILLSTNKALILGDKFDRINQEYTYSFWLFDIGSGVAKEIATGFKPVESNPCLSAIKLNNSKILIVLEGVDNSRLDVGKADVDFGSFYLAVFDSFKNKLSYLKETIPRQKPGCVSAVQLKNGKILITSQNKVMHLYDPSLERISKVRFSNYEGYSSAVLLKSGRVLFTGGTVASPFWSADWIPLPEIWCPFHPYGAELFNPYSNTFEKTGTLNIPRDGHYSIPLVTGSALILGGIDRSDCDYDEIAKQVEIFKVGEGQ